MYHLHSRLSSYVRKSGGHYDLQHALTNLPTFTHMYSKIKHTVSEQLLKKLLLTNPYRVLYSNLQHAAEKNKRDCSVYVFN